MQVADAVEDHGPQLGIIGEARAEGGVHEGTTVASSEQIVDGRVVVHRQIGRLDQMARRRELLLTDPGWRHAVDRQPTVEQRRVAREAERRERALERFWKEAGEL